MTGARKFCINCGKEIPSAAAYCPYCSQLQLDVLPKPAPPKKEETEAKEKESEKKPTESDEKKSDSEKMEHIYKRSNTTSHNIVPKEMRTEYRTERQEMIGDEKDELIKKAYTDLETGFYNQTKLDELASNVSPNDIVVIGVVKVVNYNSTVNTYGREEGYKLLKIVAEAIGNVCPKEAYRIEGGEFIIVFFNKTIMDLQKNMSDIINMLDENMVRNKKKNEYNYSVPEISCGTTELKSGEAFYNGLRRAEAEALDEVKSSVAKQKYNNDQNEFNPGTTNDQVKTKIRGNISHSAKDEYKSQKRSYNNVLSRRLTETVILAVLLFATVFAKNYFGC